jgi:hypothetical protein
MSVNFDGIAGFLQVHGFYDLTWLVLFERLPGNQEDASSCKSFADIFYHFLVYVIWVRVKKNPTDVGIQCIAERYKHEINTERLELLSQGVLHTEGGWPKDVDCSEIEQVRIL